MTRYTTGLADYQQGLALEAEGKSGEQVAKALGLKNAKVWWSMKHAYKKRQDAFNARARGEEFSATADATLPAVAAPATSSATTLRLLAVGLWAHYEITDSVITIRGNEKDGSVVVAADSIEDLIGEIRQAAKRLGRA